MLLHLLIGFLHFLNFPQNAVSTVTITNETGSGDLTALYAVMPSEKTVSENLLDSSIPDGESAIISLPYMFYPAMIGFTSSDLSYRYLSFAAVDSSTIVFDRMKREFGKLITRMYGSTKLFIANTSPLQIVSITVSDSCGFPGEILTPEVIFTGEAINIWLNPGLFNITVRDISNTCVEYTLQIDTIAEATIVVFPAEFVSSENTELTVGTGRYSADLVPALPYDSLCILDLFNEEGEMSASFNIEPPLSSWSRIRMYSDEEIFWLSGEDTNGRTYSVNSVDSLLGAYIIDAGSVDFDLSFDSRVSGDNL